MRAAGSWWATFWLRLLFTLSSTMPWLPRVLRPVGVRFAWLTSRSIRRAVRCNSARLFGSEISPKQSRKYGLRVISNFYNAVVEFGRNRGLSPEQLAHRLDRVEGAEEFDQARALRRGVILVTAHLGSFETAIGILRTSEPRVHVVFRRDQYGAFESLRSRQRERLGVIEAPIDKGLTTWIGLRDALRADEVVLFQADRCLPGQAGESTPFLGGHLRVPTGPVRLSRLTGSPIVPVFAVEVENHKLRVMHGKMIDPQTHRAPKRGEPDPIVRLIAAEIERVVTQWPDQWLCLHPVLEEDRPREDVP